MKENTQEPADAVAAAAEMHPVAEVTGGVAGGIAGAVIGSALGPLGALTGAVIGVASGAIAGGGISQGIKPDDSEPAWLHHFRNEEFAREEHSLRDYGPAYHLGWLAYADQNSFDESQHLLQEGWLRKRGDSRLEWPEVISVARAGWNSRASQGMH